MALFSVSKVFYFCRMPSDVKIEVSGGLDKPIPLHHNGDVVIRVFLIGYDDLPLTRAWLLRNGAEKSDRFVYVLLGSIGGNENGTKG